MTSARGDEYPREIFCLPFFLTELVEELVEFGLGADGVREEGSAGRGSGPAKASVSAQLQKFYQKKKRS